MEQIHFGGRWGTKLSKPMSREQAFEWHQKGEGYAVAIGDMAHPKYVIDVCVWPCLVRFLDENKNTFLSCQYDEIDKERLFLSRAFRREIDPHPQAAECLRSTSYRFSTNGHVMIGQTDVRSKVTDPFEAQADVSDHFVKKPGFGEYDELIRWREFKIVPGSVKPRAWPAQPVKRKARSFGTSATLYYEAKRLQPLSATEQFEANRIATKYSVDNQIEKYLQTAEGLNWTSFDLQLNPKPGVILSGSTQLPGNTDNPVAAATQGVEHWSACLAELRRAIKGADWTVTVEDAPLTWDEQRQLYDLTK